MEVIKEKVKLGQVTRRDAGWGDFPLFKEWRNLPYIYQTMIEDARPLSDEEIAAWIGSYINDEEHKYGTLGIVLIDGKPIGWQISRDFQSGIPEVGLTIVDRNYWGTGLTTEMDSIGMGRLKGMGFTKVRARTRKDNPRILVMLPRQGYVKVFENEAEIAWVRDI